MRSSGRTSLSLMSAIACTVLVACGSGGSDPVPSESGSSARIRIGVEGPITGDQSVTGEGMVNGAKLAADAVNAAGGVNGQQIEIVPIDDAADPATGVKAAGDAIAAGLDGVIGPYNSSVGVQTLPLYQAAGLVPMRLTSNDDTSGMGYTLQPMDYQIATAASTGLTQWLKAKSVAIIYDSSQNYTLQIARKLKKQLKQAGVAVPVYEPIAPGASEYSKPVAMAAAAKPDVIYAATYFPEGGVIAKEMVDSQVPAQCVADYASADPGFVTTAGQEAAKECHVVGVPAPGDFPTGPEFVDRYKAAFGQDPGTWSPYTYDSLNLLAEAATAAGGFDEPGLTQFIDAVKGWEGVTGSVTIDASNGNRDPATVAYLAVNDAGELHVDKDWAAAVGAPY